MRITGPLNQCDKCGHIWYAKDPARCAKCKTPAWNKSERVSEETRDALAEAKQTDRESTQVDVRSGLYDAHNASTK
jgi:predicted  nucleic acid-binding Zn-ribbon protein